MFASIKLESRRKRLARALNDLPYKTHLLDFSKDQKLVIEIVERLSSAQADETPVASTSKAPPKEKSIQLISLKDILERYRPQKANDAEQAAQIFAEKPLQSIELTEGDSNNCSNPSENTCTFENKLDMLTNAASQLCVTRREMQDEFSHCEEKRQEMLDEREREKLLTMHIGNMVEAQLKLVQEWEVIKRKALRLLTIEIDKLQNLEDELNEAEEDQEILDDIDEIFNEFCDGTDEHNTSTPKTPDVRETSTSDDSELSAMKRKNANVLHSTPSSKCMCVDGVAKQEKSSIGDDFKVDEDGDSDMVTIGPNGTQIKRAAYNKLDWNQSASAITRKILCSVFERKTLVYHTLTGKPSPAFADCGKPQKAQLDPLKINDIVHLVMSKVETTPRDVRTAISTKCADENKKYRRQLASKNLGKTI